ncbi:MAG: UDP-N-acetylmuramoyl-L-alanyl-D-glutamate--2,6-diaminopimelate ligase [Lachnospiraceae bacterium]|nr:UDP-N-acetylmuramoyl-L-alanyl-D-glutamate--2,6-diaminopimelate ligase [Lachnospiraceae bacterium]
MKLEKLIERLELKNPPENKEIEIRRLIYDSRKVREGDLFVCIAGANFDAHDKAEEVARAGAAVIVAEREITVPADSACTVLYVKDTREALSLLSAAWFDYPAERIKTIAVTGTKGKTSTTYMIRDILESVGIRCGLIGTIETIAGTLRKPNLNTTPESYEIQEAFDTMVKSGMEAVVMEVSSQGLMLKRVYGITFDYACFTNLSPDHIGPNEHKDFEDYKFWKRQLFLQSKTGIFNADDPFWKEMAEGAPCIRETFGFAEEADYRASDMTLFSGKGFLGTRYRISGKAEAEIELHVPGSFSVHNSLMALAVSLHFTDNMKRIKEALLNVRIKGRVEIIPVKEEYTVMIDYAHNAVALESLLKTIREYRPKRIVTLFGCGGNRDRNRRFEMGEVSSRLSDLSIVTSDNPRKEEPEAIIEDILTGVKKADGKYIAITDRREAIRYALENGQEGDVIILAGKGHEDYQEINGKKYPMDERVIIREIKNSWK